MKNIKFLEGTVFSDYRGTLTHCNDFDLTDVTRFYYITHSDTSIVRAWHGHQRERKWFYVVRGSFTGAFVRVDDWENPSPDLVPEVFTLSASAPGVLCVPAGYANGFKAVEPNSVLLVFSDRRMPEALDDSWRYDPEMWLDWSAL